MFFQLKFTLTYLNVKRQNANRALLLQCQCNSMTSRCSSQSCWLSMLRQGPVKKRCPTMSNHVKPESLQCDLRQYTATGDCNHGKPTKIHEPNHALPTNRRLFGSFRKFYSFMMFYGSQILKKKTHLPHSSTSWWIQQNWKICLSNWIISPGRDNNKKSLKPPISHLLMQLYPPPKFYRKDPTLSYWEPDTFQGVNSLLNFGVGWLTFRLCH